jgi:hypothetical protein
VLAGMLPHICFGLKVLPERRGSSSGLVFVRSWVSIPFHAH